MITDRISDTLVRFKNAFKVKNQFVLIPFTKLNLEIIIKLKQYSWISNFECVRIREQYFLNIFLKYKIINKIKISIVTDVKRISKPSLRLYIKAKEVKKLSNKKEMYFISTSKGIMNNFSASKESLGGELLFSIF